MVQLNLNNLCLTDGEKTVPCLYVGETHTIDPFEHITRIEITVPDSVFCVDGPARTLPPIRNVIFNPPATIVLWGDGAKTVVKCGEGDTYSKELGLAMCMAKKALGNKGNYNKVFKKWLKEENE